MWAHPGKKLLFMGCEFAQRAEWNHDRSLDWHLTNAPSHAGVQALVRDLNHLYRARPVVCIANLSPVPRHEYQLGLPRAGTYVERLNTDAAVYGGSGVGNHGSVLAEATPWDNQPASAKLTLPPLSVLWLTPAP